MRAAMALLLALPALAGCTSMDEFDPLTMACKEAAVQEAGWCGGVAVDGLEDLGDRGGAKAPKGPQVERTADGVRWTHTLDGSHDHFSLTWDSPGRARVSWSAAGSGGMRVAVRDAGGNALYASAPGAASGGETLAGRAGAWSASVDFDNFAGSATLELRAT